MDELFKYAVTFASAHPLGNGYVVVEAHNFDEANELVRRFFGDKYCCIHTLEHMLKLKDKYYHDGQLGKVLR